MFTVKCVAMAVEAFCMLSCARGNFECWQHTVFLGTLSAIAPLENQPKTVMTKMAIQRRIFGRRLHEALDTGDIGEDKP